VRNQEKRTEPQNLLVIGAVFTVLGLVATFAVTHRAERVLLSLLQGRTYVGKVVDLGIRPAPPGSRKPYIRVAEIIFRDERGRVHRFSSERSVALQPPGSRLPVRWKPGGDPVVALAPWSLVLGTAAAWVVALGFFVLGLFLIRLHLKQKKEGGNVHATGTVS